MQRLLQDFQERQNNMQILHYELLKSCMRSCDMHTLCLTRCLLLSSFRLYMREVGDEGDEGSTMFACSSLQQHSR
jgi:hypothetical protein